MAKGLYRLKLISLVVLCSIIALYAWNRYTLYSVELYDFPHYTPRRLGKQTVKSGVPLVIYGYWHSRSIPKGMKENIEKLLEVNPEFDYYLYSEDDAIKFIQDNYSPDVLTAFKSLKPGAYKSDLWRYCILYKYGGIYIDMKFYSTSPLIDVLQDNSIVYAADQPKWCNGKSVYNAFMISTPNNNIFKECIDDIVNSTRLKLYKRNGLDITGPCLLGEMIHKRPSEVSKIKITLIDGMELEYKGKILLKQYPSYRDEQKRTQVHEYYMSLYDKKDVYNV
jgi:mannosyltransferase OCH1-like enzyme